MYRVETPADVTTLLRLKLPEGPSLEYKTILSLTSRSQRGEALKDLTGMGNGGGGTVVFGIAEDPSNDDLPGAVQPLTDPGVVAQLDAIVRDGVRPPLLSETRVIDWPGGFLLAVEVLKSQFGLYMIEGYGEHRYYRRTHRSTIPMSEQEVRDAYALASRWRSSREDVWREYGLPTPAPEGSPWLTVSAVPEAPFHDLVDPSTTHRDQLRLPNDQSWILVQAGFGVLYQNLRVWADGYYAEESEEGRLARSIRIMRLGIVGLGLALAPNDSIGIWLPQTVNAQLLLLGWVWRCLEFRASAEVEVEIHGPHHLHLEVPNRLAGRERRSLQHPWPHTTQLRVSVKVTVLPWELDSAPHRHLIVRKVWDRVHQAYGEHRAPFEYFHTGWLYDMEGKITNCYLGPGSVQRPIEHLFRVCRDGALERARDAKVVGWVDEGAVYDLEGCGIASTEFATSSGLPRGYRVAQPIGTAAPRPTALERDPTEGRAAPAFPGLPSALTLQGLLTIEPDSQHRP